MVIKVMDEDKYRIGDLARKARVTVRTVRYYESLNLIKPTHRSEGGQRYYSEKDLVYLKRILELKELDFTLEEIKKIINLKEVDSSGVKRRNELLHQYRKKLSTVLDKKVALEAQIDSINWHIRQLESNIDFRECPGKDCQSCQFKEECRFSQDDYPEY